MPYPVNLHELSTAFRARVKEKIDAAMFARPLLFYLKSRGRVDYKVPGPGFEANVYMRKRRFTPDADVAGTAVFTQQDPYRIAKLSWVSGWLTDSIGRRQHERNTNDHPGKVIDVITDMMQRHVDNFETAFAEFFFKNGTSGLNVMGGWETALTAHATATSGGGKLRQPNGSYAGISTVLGAESDASWPSGIANWPEGPAGENSEAFCFWSPLLVNETNTTGWGTGASWATKADAIILWTTAQQRKLGMNPDLLVTTAERRVALDTLFQGQQRIMMDSTPKTEQALGFRVTNYNGVDVVDDAACPAGTAYIINYKSHLHYKSIYDDLTYISDIQALENGSGIISRQDYHGNFWFIPRALAKITAYS